MPGPDRKKMDLGARLQALLAAATTMGIVAGAIWTYMLFIEQRLLYAHVKIEHQATHMPLLNHRVKLILDVICTNVGSVRVKLTSGDVKIESLDKTAYTSDKDQGSWIYEHENSDLPDDYLLKTANPADPPSREVSIEPGESNQLHYEFIVSDDSPLRISTYYRNPTAAQDTGWVNYSVYDPTRPPAPASGP